MTWLSRVPEDLARLARVCGYGLRGFRPRHARLGVAAAGAVALYLAATHLERLPSDLLGERGLDPSGLAVVRAPEDADGIRGGDRILIDTGDRAGSPPALALWWDGYAVRLALVELVRRRGKALLRLERPGAEVRELAAGDEGEVLGRVVGRWTWT